MTMLRNLYSITAGENLQSQKIVVRIKNGLGSNKDSHDIS